MFCPSCGSEEYQATQFCRACGIDLRTVRISMERPDAIAMSAVSAREEIGRAIAEKIRAIDDTRDLKRVAEDVLPEIEKFLESPEEKRLRRMRVGVITAAGGLGTMILGLVLASIIFGNVGQLLTMGGAGLGLVLFLIGLAFVLNSTRFTQPKGGLAEPSSDARSQNLLDVGYTPPRIRSSAEATPPTNKTSGLSPAAGSSVTEHTTHHLKTDR